MNAHRVYCHKRSFHKGTVWIEDFFVFLLKCFNMYAALILFFQSLCVEI